MMPNRDHDSANKTPNNFLTKITVVLIFLTIIFAFLGGGAIVLVILNWEKIFGGVSPLANVSSAPTTISSPTMTVSPSSVESPVSLSPLPTQSVSPSPSPALTPPSRAVTQQDISFEILGCQKSPIDTTTQRIQCSLNIKSLRENAQVSFYRNSGESRKTRIFGAGNESIAKTVEFGSSANSYRVSNNLIKDVPLKAIFSFDKVPLEINTIEVLEISSSLESSYYQGDIKIEFRDILLSN